MTNMNDFQVPEIMKGTEAGSNFMVIAKNQGLKVGIRPLGGPNQDGETTWLCVGFRLRVENDDSTGNTATASGAFGIPGFTVKKQGHASVVGRVKVITMPCSPAEAYEVFQDGQLTQQIVATLIDKMELAGATFAVEASQIVEYLNLGYDTLIPNEKPTTPDEFKVEFGAA